MTVKTPSILTLLDKYKVTYTDEIRGQVRISCPSKCTDEINCSVNLERNVYYCHTCNTGGGVKKLEAVLSNKPIAKKYGAAALTTKQLYLIGWEMLKESDRNFYRQNHKKVMADWNNYEVGQLSKMYALFLIMNHVKVQSVGAKVYDYLLEMFEHSKIPNVDMMYFIDILIESEQNSDKKLPFVKEGEKIARLAIKECRRLGDKDFTSALMLIIFDFHKCKVPVSEMMKLNVQFYSVKRFNFNHLQNVFHWEKHRHNTLVYAFALFTLVMYEENKQEQVELYKKLSFFIRHSIIEFKYGELIDQLALENIYREEWAREGTRLARIVWRNSNNVSRGDFLTALFIHLKYTKPLKKPNMRERKVI